MKKMFVLFALCAMASSLMATTFTDAGYKNGAFTIPVVYTGMLKINAWGDEGLCYNWRSNRNSYPLFLGLCQPCLDCVPCDIDMRHLPSTIQYGDNSDGVENAVPSTTKKNVDETEAFFNRARLYVVVGTAPAEKDAKGKVTVDKTVTIKVIDLIDAYWGKDKNFSTPVLFQFYNTVDSIGRTNEGASSRGRIAAFYQFPIFSRDYIADSYAVRINDFDDDTNLRHNNTEAAPSAEGATDGCVVDRFEDGIALAALIGTKDYKSFFKAKVDGKSVSYKIVSIKSFSGDFFASQREFANVDGDGDFKYACRKGEDYVVYKNTTSVPAKNNTHFDGLGAWYATGSITLRRNDSVTKSIMNDIFTEEKHVTCIPCNDYEQGTECRSYLDQGMVKNLINRQYNGWRIKYIVDLDNDGIYGENASCGGLQEWAIVDKNTDIQKNLYLKNPNAGGLLVNTSTANDAFYQVDEKTGKGTEKDSYDKAPYTYNLPEKSAQLVDKE